MTFDNTVKKTLCAALLGAVMIAPALGCVDDGINDGQCRAPEDMCDISETECQRAVYELTCCIRGVDTAHMPPVRLVSSNEYLTEMAQQTEQTVSDTPWDKALQYLGLVASGVPSIRVKNRNTRQVTPEAYYSTVTKDVVIIKKRDRGLRIGMEVLSHEYTHAIQDRLYGFEKLENLYVHTFDNMVSMMSLEEGDAQATSKRAGLRITGTTTDEYDWESTFQIELASVLITIADASSPLLVASLQTLPYVIGAHAVQQVWVTNGRHSVDDLFSNPPLAFVDWVSPATLGEESKPEPLRCYPPIPPGDLSLFDMDSLGVAGLIALLSVAPGGEESDTYEAFELASELVGDSMAVYATPAANDEMASPIAVVWRTRWSTPEVAQRVEKWIEKGGPQVQTRVDDQELLIVSGDQQSQIQTLIGAGTACTALKDLEALIPERSE